MSWALLRSRAGDLHGHGVKRLALFGSVARSEAHAASDVDLLVGFIPMLEWALAIASLKRELDLLLGRPVGLTFASRAGRGPEGAILSGISCRFSRHG